MLKDCLPFLKSREVLRGLLYFFLAQFLVMLIMLLSEQSLLLTIPLGLLAILFVGQGSLAVVGKEHWKWAAVVGLTFFFVETFAALLLSALVAVFSFTLPFFSAVLSAFQWVVMLAYIYTYRAHFVSHYPPWGEALKRAVVNIKGFGLAFLLALVSYNAANYTAALGPLSAENYVQVLILTIIDAYVRAVAIGCIARQYGASRKQ